jgi:ComF family protein
MWGGEVPVICGLVPIGILFDKCHVANLLQIFRSALDLVLPERCPCCGAITPPGGDFCAACWQQLRFLVPPWCGQCAVPLEFATDDEQICASCLATPPLHDGIRAAVVYNDVSRHVVLRMKYGGKIGMAKLIAKHLRRHLPDPSETILVVPVPLHWTRLWGRGFNQSALIAKALARPGSLSFCPDALVRQQQTPFLRGMSRKQRAKTVGSAFALNPKMADQIKGARILLIDDVMTSGATSNACVKTLKRAGAEWVQIFCWARVVHSAPMASDATFTVDA